MAHAFLQQGGEDGSAKATGTGDTASLTYRVVECFTKAQALVAVHALRPATIVQDGTTLKYDAIDPKHVEAEVWEVKVSYVHPDAQEKDDTQNEAPEWSFDTTGGGTSHITHGYAVRNAYPLGADKNTYGGAIGVQVDTKGGLKINGLDVGIPGLDFTLTTKIPPPANPHNLARQYARASWKTNNAPWYGFDAGEVLFKGVRLAGKSSEKWQLVFTFTASENITLADNWVIENLGAIEKRGFDHFDIVWQPTIDEAKNTLVAKPLYGFVHQIYRETGFHAFGLGG